MVNAFRKGKGLRNGYGFRARRDRVTLYEKPWGGSKRNLAAFGANARNDVNIAKCLSRVKCAKSENQLPVPKPTWRERSASQGVHATSARDS